ncbi:MAG: hypothetical protein AMXMBFR64_19770 [Myxococcales bacterium]
MAAHRVRPALLIALAVAAGIAALVVWLAPGGMRSTGAPPRRVAHAEPEDAGAVEETVPVLVGRVVAAPTNRGVPGATVLLDGLEVAVTDAEGRFTVVDATEGRYVLTARADGYVGPPPTGAPPLEVRIEPGLTVSGVRVTLYSGASIGGRVVAAGKPVAGAALSLYYDAAPGAREPFVTEATARTDASGGFTLWPVHPGRVRVLAEADGWSMGESDEVVAESGDPVTDVLIDLGASAALAGVVLDVQGRPITGAEVWVTSTRTGRRNTTTDGSGRFELRALPAGAAEVHARASGYEDAPVQALELGANEETRVELRLAQAPGFGGLVVSPGGQPVAEAVVTWMPESSAAMHRRPGGLAGMRAVTDAKGRFWVRQVPTEPVVMVATHREYAASEERTVPLGVREVTLTLSPGGSLSGRVIDAVGRRPVTTYEVAMVSFKSRDGAVQGGGGFERLTVADPDGRFQFTGLTPGTYAISVLADGFRAERVDNIEVWAGQETSDVEVRLHRGGAVTGLIVDAVSGAPIPQAYVTVTTLYEQGYRRGGPGALTNGEGRFRMEGLPEGPRSLNVRARGYESLISSGHVVPSDGERDIGVIRLAPEKPGERGVTKFSGIGTVLREQDGRIYAARIIEDSPAAAMGLETDTEILSVDGRDLSSMTMTEAVERIRGQEGSDVTLMVLRPGAAVPERILITRGQVTMQR